MRYVVDYELCALLFLLVVVVRYFSMRQFPGRLDRLFGAILICAAADLALDLIGVLTIEYCAYYPVWLTHVINTAFYSLQNILPVLMMSYVMLMLDGRGQRVRGRRFLYLPAALMQVVLLSNPFTGAVFFLDAQKAYLHGPLFPLLYAGMGFYLLVTLWLICTRRRALDARQFNTIFAFLVVVAAAAGIQIIFPAYLLTGVAITLAIMLMYFTLQNPEDMRDEMTGTFNYGALLYLLRDCTLRKTPFYVIALELVDMRRINTLFGLDIGNRVMAGVGAFLQEYGRRSWAFHTFGTRFVVVAYERADYTALLGRIAARFAQPWDMDGVSMRLTATVRHFSNADVALDAQNVITLIDAAFADAQEREHGTIAELTGPRSARLRRHIAVEDALREALERGGEGFTLHFQPLLSKRNGRFTTAEALLRFTDPVVGTVAPGEFIPIAEKGGLIAALDEVVLERACDFLRRCDPRALGLTGLQINLSAAEFFIGDLPARLKNTADRYGADPSLLCFEVTETAATAAFSVVRGAMREMQSHGFRLVLDDFGSGYANLTQVMRLPFSQVKLDHSLLRAACEGESVMLTSMVDMLRRLGLEVVVEGVETAAQADMVNSLDVDYIQGFFYALPMPEEAFTAFLRARL